MSSNKAKGTRYERLVLNYLHAAGFTSAERSAPGTPSRDFGGVVHRLKAVCVEAKCHARGRFGEWLPLMFARHGPTRWWLFARIGDQRGDGYEVVVMPVDEWRRLVDLPKGSATNADQS